MKIASSISQISSNLFQTREVRKSSTPPQASEIKPPLSSDAAVIRTTNINTRQRLEKHLNDHKTGQGHLSREMYGEVSRMRESNSNMLADMDPDAAALNSAYQTLNDSYSKKARNAQFMKTVITEMRNLTTAYAQLEEGSEDLK